jgi:hypothetical protein
MENQIKTLIEAIVSDYATFTRRSFEANGYSTDPEINIEKFRDELNVFDRGTKYIRIETGNSVWGFINKGNPDFKVGDILKAKSWKGPATNKARGNIFEYYSVAWTGPHYISGYSAGGERAPAEFTGLLRGGSKIVEGESNDKA